MWRFLTKFWKQTAYVVGLLGFGFAYNAGIEVEPFSMLYTSIGCVWFVVWLLRNSDGRAKHEFVIEDSRGPYGSVSSYYRDK